MMRKKSLLRVRNYSRSPLRSLFFVSCLCFSLMACGTKGHISRGYEFNDAAVAQVKVGMPVDKVLNLMGSPSTIATVGNKIFYYIGQHMKKGSHAFGHTLIEQRVMVIAFDSQFKVARINTYNLKDGVLVPLHKGETETESLDKGLFQKLFGGVGSFSPFGISPEFKPTPSVSGN